MKTLLSVLALAVLGGSSAVAGGPPINDVCPVCGKTPRLIFRTFTDKGTVIFATVDCKESYEKSPTRYTVKPKTKKD
ncbi:MAG: hypothetical protein U0984_08460 [Prosthecobacter sp.]|nr:hypothetical protein [Prosthecobacter sp.]